MAQTDISSPCWMMSCPAQWMALMQAACLAGELGEAGEHMHKLAEQDMENYIKDGHQNEDEVHLKKLQV